MKPKTVPTALLHRIDVCWRVSNCSIGQWVVQGQHLAIDSASDRLFNVETASLQQQVLSLGHATYVAGAAR